MNHACFWWGHKDSTPGSTPEKTVWQLSIPSEKWPDGIFKNDRVFFHRFGITKRCSCACHGQLHNCSNWLNQVWHPAALTKTDIYTQWCKNNGKNIYCDFCKIMDSTPGSTPEKMVWQLSITLHSEWKNDQVESARTMAFFSADLE